MGLVGAGVGGVLCSAVPWAGMAEALQCPSLARLGVAEGALGSHSGCGGAGCQVATAAVAAAAAGGGERAHMHQGGPKSQPGA